MDIPTLSVQLVYIYVYIYILYMCVFIIVWWISLYCLAAAGGGPQLNSFELYPQGLLSAPNGQVYVFTSAGLCVYLSVSIR